MLKPLLALSLIASLSMVSAWQPSASAAVDAPDAPQIEPPTVDPAIPATSNSERLQLERKLGKPVLLDSLPGPLSLVRAHYNGKVKLVANRQTFHGKMSVIWNAAGESGLKQVDLDQAVGIQNDQGGLDEDKVTTMIALGTMFIATPAELAELKIVDAGALPIPGTDRSYLFVGYNNEKCAYVVVRKNASSSQVIAVGGTFIKLLKFLSAGGSVVEGKAAV